MLSAEHDYLNLINNYSVQELKAECLALFKENRELKDLLEKAVNRYDLRARSTFGRKTESLLSLIEAASEKIDEAEDEAQYETGSEKTAAAPRIINFDSEKHAGKLSDGKKAHKKSRQSRTSCQIHGKSS